MKEYELQLQVTLKGTIIDIEAWKIMSSL